MARLVRLYSRDPKTLHKKGGGADAGDPFSRIGKRGRQAEIHGHLRAVSPADGADGAPHFEGLA